MFARCLSIQRIDASGDRHKCPIGWIDNFAMRNFTNEAVFDDTLPAGDGVHGFAVATRDTAPFLAAGVTVINPWQS
jgi:hypothetical protein